MELLGLKSLSLGLPELKPLRLKPPRLRWLSMDPLGAGLLAAGRRGLGLLGLRLPWLKPLTLKPLGLGLLSPGPLGPELPRLELLLLG